MALRAWLVLAVMPACAGFSAPAPFPAPAPPAPAPPTTAPASHSSRAVAEVDIVYRVRFTAGARRAFVEACFPNAPPAAFVAGREGDASRVSRPILVEPDGRTRSLVARDARIACPKAPPGSCLRYEVALDGAARRYGQAAVVPNGAWLWRPPRSRWPTHSRLAFRFVLAPGERLSVPWPRGVDGTYRPDTHAFAFISHAVVGRFEELAFDSAGARFHVALLPGTGALSERIEPWLATASGAVADVGGRFPVDRVQVIVLPGGGRGEPVGFSMVGRGGGASVTFRVDPSADLATLRANWTAVHEFGHLWLPFVRRPDAWLSEGLATYLQEVLRVRAGVHREARAWARLASGARRGLGAADSLAAESRTMYRDFSFRKIYWGGAAFWLLADVALRSDHGISLDHALAQLRQDYAPPAGSVNARALLRELDRVNNTDVFTSLAERVVYRAPYPRLAPTFERLGVVVVGDSVQLQPASLSGLRQAIMHGP